MKKLILSLAASFMMLSSFAQQSTWNVDASHSNVKFSVTHLVVSEVEGYFRNFNGSMTASKVDWSDAKITFTVDVASINTDNADRDAHLKSDDFFNAEKYPKMTFKSTSVKKVGDKKYILEGDLTIRDVTKRVRFEVTGGGTVVDPWGNTKAGFKAITTINRAEYGLLWSKTTEAGGLVVSNDVTVMLNMEFAKAK